MSEQEKAWELYEWYLRCKNRSRLVKYSPEILFFGSLAIAYLLGWMGVHGPGIYIIFGGLFGMMGLNWLLDKRTRRPYWMDEW